MKLKLDEKGAAVLLEGKPVYVKDDGKELTFDAKEAFDKISSLNAENAGFRTRFNKAEADLKVYEGIDAEGARKALDTVKNLDLKKLVDAGEVEKVKEQVAKVFETQLSEAKSKWQKAEQALFTEKIGGVFSRSKFIADKCAVPADMLQALFGSRFKVEDDGAIVANDLSGNKIYSRRPESAGAIAQPDEALEIMLDSYPYKAQVLKGTGAAGGGSQESGGQRGTGIVNGAGKQQLPRAQWEAMDPATQANMAKDPKVLIVD
jgi:hypothetical protein